MTTDRRTDGDTSALVELRFAAKNTDLQNLKVGHKFRIVVPPLNESDEI